MSPAARGAASEPPEIRGTGYCVDALEAALWAVGGATDFRDAVLRAANLGDDADTTAAIAGQLAGARWGWSGIPAAWRDRIVAGDRIAAIAGRLFDLAVGAAANDEWPLDATIHGWWVEPGALLAGEYPGATTPDVAEARIDVLVDHGVRTFIDLTETVDGLEPYAEHVATIGARRGLDLHHRPFPIPDMGVRSAEGYDEILEAIRESTDRGVVYIHCWGGIGRTSTVVGCLLVDAGLDADAALADITRRRSTTRKAHRAAPETPASDRCHSRPRCPTPFARQRSPMLTGRNHHLNGFTSISESSTGFPGCSRPDAGGRQDRAHAGSVARSVVRGGQLLVAVGAGAAAVGALEGGAERERAAVADGSGDGGDGGVGLDHQVGGEGHPPAGEERHRRFADQLVETPGEQRPRDPDGRGEARRRSTAAPGRSA